jgi:hypothetical protein
LAVLRDITENALPAGWTDEGIVVLIGDVRLDLRNRLSVSGLLGDLEVAE